MEKAAWVAVVIMGLYLYKRWEKISDIQDTIDKKFTELSASFEEIKNDNIELSRKISRIYLATSGIRRKLGFDSDWAEYKHDQEYIDALQNELDRRQRRESEGNL